MDRGDDRKKSKPTSTKKKNEGELSDEDYDPEMENLNAIEKEQLYLERLERKEKEKRKQELEKEAKASKGAQKKELLSELQSKRQNAKDKKERMIAEENRDDSDENDSESEGEINSKRKKKRDADEDFVVDDDKDMRGSRPEKKRKKSPSQEKRASEKSQTLTMEVLEKIRLSRKNLALLCSHTIFEKTVKGAFVRVNQSSSAKASAHDYVIAEIVGIKDYTKYYPVDDKETNKILMLKHGGKERPMKICFVSNGEFTGGEFTKWINKMQREGQKIPTVGDIERKKSEIDQGLNYRYSESEIRQNIDQRIQEKLRKGDALTYHEIEILENKKIQKEREYLMVVKRDEGAKKEIERLDESIKKAKSLLREQRTSKPLKKEEDRNVLNEMDEMFKEDEEENKEPERNNRNHKAHEREERGREVIEEDEDDKLENEKMIEEMKKRGVTMTEMYEEMKKEFIKAHKVDLSIDKMIDEWEIEGEAAAS